MRPTNRITDADTEASASRISSSDSHFSLAHSIELQVTRALFAKCTCEFHSLVVHRTQAGICLEGIVYGDEGNSAAIRHIAASVPGVAGVIDRLTYQQPVPPKG